MKETMGQIIRRLRKERNLTQEELADQLNISSQAVSKWENNTAMPDISQVVPLANFFGVSTDVLFGFCGTDHEEDIKNRLSEIFRMMDHCKDGEEGPTALVILDKYRDAMRMYPSNDTLLTNAMAFASMVLENNRTDLCKLIGDEGVQGLENEVVHWAELVIKYSTSANEILSAKERLIEINLWHKNFDAALELTKDFPSFIQMIVYARKADVYYRAGRRKEELDTRGYHISELFREFANQIYMVENIYVAGERYEDALYCCEVMRDITNAVYRAESYRPPLMYDHKNLYRTHALCLMMLGRKEEAVTVLENGVEFIMAQAKDYNKKTDLHIPIFPDVRFSYGFDGNAEYKDSGERAKKLVSDEIFAPLHDVHTYRALVEKMNDVI